MSLIPGLEIHFFGGSKLLLLSSRPGSKTNFVVAKLYVHSSWVVQMVALQTLHKNALN